MTRILRSKFLLPRTDDSLPRPRLAAIPAVGTLLVQAPAGSGKSLFLAQWLTAQALPFLYYQLDEQDRDGCVFAAHLLAGMQQLWPDWRPAPDAETRPDELAVELVNEATARPPFILALDRLDAAFGESYLTDFVSLLQRYMPPSMTLLLATRAPLPTGRNTRLVSATLLAMTPDEAESWLGGGDWDDCFRQTGGYPLALRCWQRARADWRPALQAEMLAGLPAHIPPDIGRALLTEWLDGRMDLPTFAVRLAQGEPGAERLWGEALQIRNLLLAGSFKDAVDRLKPLWEKVRAEAGGALVGAVALLQGEFYYGKGQYGLAMEWYHQAFEADPLLELTGTHSMVSILRDQGDLTRASDLVVRCIAARRNRGDLQALAYALHQHGALLMELGRFDEAEQQLAEAQHIGLDLSGEPFYGILAMAHRAILMAYRGNQAGFRRLAEEAYRLAHSRSQWLTAITGYILAPALLAWGEREAGLRLRQESLAYLTAIDSRWQLHMIYAQSARFAWVDGRQDEARTLFDRSLALAAAEHYVQFLQSERAGIRDLLVDALVRGVQTPFCQELLGLMGARALPALLALAHSDAPAARRAALYPLVAVGGPEAVQAIRHLLYDPVDFVRDGALIALQSLGEALPAAATLPADAPPTAAAPGDITLAISVLGPMVVQAGGQKLANWRTAKARDLLAYLLLHEGRPVTRDQILEALWPESGPEAGQGLLHTTLYYLRKALQPASDGLITFAGGAYRLELDQVESDLLRFKLLATGGISDRAAAAALYRGDLLEGMDYPWCDAPRTQLRTQYLQLLRQLADACATAGRPSEAVHWLQQLLQVDPLQEEAHVALMACYAASGHRAAALQQYQTLARLLDEELGLEPGETARVMYRKLLD